MTKQDIVKLLKENLNIKKEVIAIKTVQNPPAEIPPYKGQALPGMCALIGEILRDGSVWYITKENLGCFEALTGTGTCENLPKDKYIAFMIEQNRDYPMHKDEDTLILYYDRVDAFFKHPENSGIGVVAGPFLRVDEPDLVLLFVTPHQTDILNRIAAYLGNFSKGFGGMGGCIFNIRYSFKTGEPSFSTSDTAWRIFVGLGEDELTYTFPYRKLLEIADYIKPTVEYVESFKQMLKF